MMAKMDNMMIMLIRKGWPYQLQMCLMGLAALKRVWDVVLSFIYDGTLEQLTSKRTSQQLKASKYVIGYHYGVLNLLPSNWCYPKGITLIQLSNLRLLGVYDKNVPWLGKVSTWWIYHFDRRGRDYSKLNQVMKFLKVFGWQRGVWEDGGTRGKWDGATVTTLWAAIWEDFVPYHQNNKTKWWCWLCFNTQKLPWPSECVIYI